MPVRARLVLVVVVMAGASPVAAETRSLSQAMRDCAEKAPRELENGPLQLECGRVFRSVYRLDEAEACFARATDLLPTSAAPFVGLADVLVVRGQDVRAAQVLALGLALDPAAPGAEATQAVLRERQALVEAEQATLAAPAPDGPAHAIWAMRAALELDEASFYRAATATFAGGAAVVDRLATIVRARYGGGVHHATVEPSPALAGDGARARVVSRVYVRRTVDVGAAARPGAESLLPADARAAHDRLDDVDRPALLVRLANLGAPVVLTVELVLEREAAEGAWKIVDLTVSGDGPEKTLAQLLASPAPAASAGGPAPAPARGSALWRVLVALAVAAVLLALAVRVRRAR